MCEYKTYFRNRELDAFITRPGGNERLQSFNKILLHLSEVPLTQDLFLFLAFSPCFGGKHNDVF